MTETAEDLTNEVMCTCSGTTRGMIYDLVMQGKDLEAISRYSGALSGCGGCEWEIGEFVRALSEHVATEQAQTEQMKADQNLAE